uniref:ZP domain-containing protein n=1 Tax=Leptobrachium leishanense TaxID=445787 RepID=A0A8C5N3C9_9ANUR
MTVEWTPSEEDIGDHVPFCFFAETVQWHSSELRCVLVIIDSKILNTVLTCNENTMTLVIKKTSTDGLYDNHLRLNDPLCLLSSNSTHHVASVGFNSCGTEVKETEHEIVFKNKVTSFDEASAVISRKHQVIIPFNCSFPKKSRVSASFRAQKAVFEFTEAAFGNFTYKFQFYTNDQFLIVQTQTPLEVMLRDMLYMEIQVTSSLPNVQLFVESCRATPHDNPNDPVFYNIIDNGCLMDETLVIYRGSNTQSRFGMEAFAFIGDHEEVYLSCTVILCKLGDPHTRCARGCISKSSVEPEARRRKRSLTSEATESLQHFISQGPMRMKRQSSSEDSDGKVTLNVNTLVMSLSGVIAVALAATTIITYKKRVSLGQYQRLPTDDL